VKAKIWILLLVIFIAALWLWFKRPQPLTVELVSVSRGAVVETVVNTRAGTVKSCHRSRLALPLGGVVATLLVQEGDRVKAGDKLLELWNEDLTANVTQAKAELAHSALVRQQSCLQAQFDRRESARLETLVKRNMASETSADNARTRATNSELACEAAKVSEQTISARLQLQQAHIKQTQLYAPFDGVIAEVNGELGEYLTPSPPGVATPPAIDLLDDRCFYVSAPIDEVDAAKLALDMPVTVTLDALPDQSFVARVRRIAPYVLDLEKQSRTVEVEAELSDFPVNRPMLIGYSADMEIEVARADDTLRLPAESLGDKGEGYLWDGQTLQLVTPVTGLRNWSWISIKEGLSEGDQLVRYPARIEFTPGMVVRAKSSQQQAEQ
jgi:HlyD family secretion protein